MNQITARNVDIVWVLLMLITIASSAIGFVGTAGLAEERPTANFWVLLMAGAKVWLVMDWFMELRLGSVRIRRAARLWLLFLVLSLLWLIT